MELTTEMVTARREQLLADYHAVLGAIRDCEYWLSILAAEPPPEKEADE